MFILGSATYNIHHDRNFIATPTNKYVNNNLGDDPERTDGRETMSPPLANTTKGGDSKPSNTSAPAPAAPRRIAVLVRGVCKQYGSGKRVTPVLQNLNMVVPEGTIYSLLGASGCGKTTLLSCCVGMRRLDKGEIRIFGAKPGTKESGVPGKRVGYMPQEIALYGEFTIKEAMQYFGRIYGMTLSQIEEKMTFLIKFLDLPPHHRQIQSLSGGQQRRVSFAVALIHDPELLILDEPTVGVDPLLRQSIWNYLCNLVNTRKTTVIITTHYIEEAKQANTVGLMRNGRLLAEDSPANLLKLHHCVSLEDAFLKLCMRDKDTNVENTNVQNNANSVPALPTLPSPDRHNVSLISMYNEKNRQHLDGVVKPEENGIVGLAFHQSKEQLVNDGSDKESNLKPDPALAKMNYLAEECYDCYAGTNCTFSPTAAYSRLKALIIKTFICMLRNMGFMAFIFILPAIQVILFCLAIGRDPLDMPFGVINNEISNLSLCDGFSGCTTANLSCLFLNQLPKQSIRIVQFESEEEAVVEIDKGLLWGYMSFPANFSGALMDRQINGLFADNSSLYESQVQIRMDMSNQQIAFTIQRILLDSFQQFSRKLLIDCEYDPVVGEIPLHFGSPVYGQDHPSFMEFMAPGIVLSIIFFMAVALTGSAFITERKEGMLDRSLVTGVTTTEVIAAHMITQVVVMIGQTALVLVFMIVVFKVPVIGPLGWAIVITLLQGVCGMSFGFLISVLCKEERNAIQLALGSFYPNLLLSGVVWPIESMPKILREISYILPETLACESMRSILTRGWGITHPQVWPGFVSSIVWSVVFFLLAIMVARFSRSK